MNNILDQVNIFAYANIAIVLGSSGIFQIVTSRGFPISFYDIVDNSLMKSILLLLLSCINVLFSTADGMEVRDQADHAEYRHEDALLMWRLNTLTYCSQETLSVYARGTLIIRRQWIVLNAKLLSIF